MSKIAIITDTDASLPADLASQYNIRQVPISIHFGDETFKTGVDINDSQLFERVDREKQLPTTSAPAPGEFAQEFQAALNGGAEAILCMTVSSAVSATYNAAKVARDMMPDAEISVVDTQNLCMGQGFMVLEAARAAEEGASIETMIERALEVGRRSHLFAALSTVEYLAMSGRIGHLAAGMASLLRIKPILSVRDGRLDLLEKVRTQKKAWSHVIELTAGVLEGRPADHMAILHVDVPDQARLFEKEVRSSLACPESIPFVELTPGLSVHSGAGLVGLAVIAASSES